VIASSTTANLQLALGPRGSVLAPYSAKLGAAWENRTELPWPIPLQGVTAFLTAGFGVQQKPVRLELRRAANLLVAMLTVALACAWFRHINIFTQRFCFCRQNKLA